MAKQRTYYQRCKALDYDLRTVRSPRGPRLSLWQAWFGRLPGGHRITCTAEYSREDACRVLWWKAVEAGLAKGD